MDHEKALLDAIEEKRERRFFELLNKTDINLFSSSLGRKLLLSAVSSEGNDRIIKILLMYGASPNYAVLVTAIQWYDENIIELLTGHLKNVNETNDCNYNLLHEVARASGDKADICEILAKCGVEVNQESLHCRRTPLYFAIERKNINVLNTLLKYGAEPCRKFYTTLGRCAPIQLVFSFPTATIENVIKYAALRIDHSDDKTVYNFFSYFRSRDKNKNDPSKLYFSYAMKCVAEARALKTFVFPNHDSTLFDLAITQGFEQYYLVKNLHVIDGAFSHLVSQPFVIYSEIIVQKFSPNVILEKILENCGRKWSVTVQNKEIFFDAYIIEKICKHLYKTDLVSMFLAFTAFPEKSEIKLMC